MPTINVSHFSESERYENERDLGLYNLTQSAQGLVDQLYRAEKSFRDLVEANRSNPTKHVMTPQRKGALTQRHTKSIWANIVSLVNQIPPREKLGENEQMVDILFYQIRQALVDLHKVCVPNGETRKLLQDLISEKVERGSLVVEPVAKKVKTRIKTASTPKAEEKVENPPPERPMAKIIELPPDAFESPKPEVGPVSRVVGKDHIDEESVSGHDTEIQSLIDSSRPNRLVQALKKKVDQMRNQDGFTSDRVFALIHSFSEGEAGSKLESNLGKVLVHIYKTAQGGGQLAIRNYVRDRYQERKMRGPIKNLLANLKIKGNGGKETDEYPFDFLQDEGHATSAEAQQAARKRRVQAAQ